MLNYSDKKQILRILNADWDNVTKEEVDSRIREIEWHIKNRERLGDEMMLFSIAHIAGSGIPF